MDSFLMMVGVVCWPLIYLMSPICLVTGIATVVWTIVELRARPEVSAGMTSEEGRDVSVLSPSQKVLFGIFWPFTASMMVCVLVMASTRFHTDEASFRAAGVTALMPIVLLLTMKINIWVVWLPLRSPLQAFAAGAIIPFLELLLLGGVLGSGAR